MFGWKSGKKDDVVEEKVDNLDRYGRERQMLIEHHGPNRAQRRGMRKRAYVPRAQNKSYTIKTV